MELYIHLSSLQLDFAEQFAILLFLHISYKFLI